MKTVLDEILSGEFEQNEFEAAYHPHLGQMQQAQLEMENAYHPHLGLMTPVTGEISHELVGTDDRKRIGDTTKNPFRWICYLELFYPDPDKPGGFLKGIGTGVLISPRHILTAGHCLYSNYKGSKGTETTAQVVSVNAFAGRNGGNYLTSAKSTGLKIHGTWQATLDERYDLGIIKLNKAISTVPVAALDGIPIGYWGSPEAGDGSKIIPFTKDQIFNNTANVAGYAADKPAWLMWHADRITNVNPAAGDELIYYTMDTCAGQSGSPVWLTNTASGNRFLIAIHTGPCVNQRGAVKFSDCVEQTGAPCIPGRKRYSSNRGVFLSKSVIDMIFGWMRAL